MYFTAQTGCCHRDLKPWNICLSEDLTQIKLIDFGQATPTDRSKAHEYLRGFVSGTRHYMAPELLDDSINDFSKVDSFAAGVVLINMLTGGDYCKKEDLPQLFSGELLSLLDSMLQPNHINRTSLEDVLKHAWCRGEIADPCQISLELCRDNKMKVLSLPPSGLPRQKTFTPYTTMISTNLSVAQIIPKFERFTFGTTKLCQANALEFGHERVTLKVGLSECTDTGMTNVAF